MSHILIIEDVKSIAGMLQAILVEAGYSVDCVYDGQQAWDILQDNNCYDLILLDRILPSLDGLELLKRIKADGVLSQTPVIMETSLSETHSIIEGIAAGAYYYLTKPVNTHLLLAVVQSALKDKDNQNQLVSNKQNFEEILRYINSGKFTCRTLEEATQLAQGISKIFPDPERVVLGLNELLINAIEHGNLDISYQEKTKLVVDGGWREEVERRLTSPDYSDRSVSILLRRKTNKIALRITDEGNGFDWQKYMEFSPERVFDPHGRGIAMTKMMSFDSLHYEGNGNTVIATVSLN
jgi:DNA-binding response OmpR family regulator